MTVQEQAALAAEELCEKARLGPGSILVVGCSTSEVRGSRIGTDSAPATGESLVEAILSVLEPKGVYLAAQCCEHLNRCLIVERSAVPGLEPVNVVPQPKAGGSFATAAYGRFRDPVAVEHIRGPGSPGPWSSSTGTPPGASPESPGRNPSGRPRAGPLRPAPPPERS